MTSNSDRKLLMTEIDQQLHLLSEQGHAPVFTSHKDVVTTLAEENDGYRRSLSRLRKVLLDSRGDGAPMGDERHRLPSDLSNVLWKIPTFSSRSSSFIQPEIMLEKELAMCAIRRQSDALLEIDPRVESTLTTWASEESSTILVIGGSSQFTDSLRHLSCEVVNHLYPKYGNAIFILNSAHIRGYFKNLGACELLRQLSYQLLKTITADMTISFLAEIIRRFHEACTTKDWFRILEALMQELTYLFVIIDVSVLQDHAKEMGPWITEFHNIFSRSAGTRTTCIKIMILTNRKIDVASKKCMHAFFGPNSNIALSGNSLRLTRAQRWARSPLPVFIPPPTRLDDANGTRRSLFRAAESNLEVEGSKEPPSVSVAQCRCPGTLINFSRQVDDQFHRENMLQPPVIVKGQHLDTFQSEPTGSHMFSNHSQVTESHGPLQHSPRTPSVEDQRRQEVGVAIICALSCEADAVEVLCDKMYDIHDFGVSHYDPNIYKVVQIGRHKAVILYMPAMGKSHAAISATNCIHSFPNIRLAVLTGVCGGIPSPYTNVEILLGDVIVSDRLVLYDFGRQFPGGFQRKDTVMDNARKPLPNIAAFLSQLKTRLGSDRLSKRTTDHLSWLRNESPQGSWAAYPGVSNDLSFEATYHHKHHEGQCAKCNSSVLSVCEAAQKARCGLLGCDKQRTVSRQRHQPALSDTEGSNILEPVIHFGAYASGDLVMKSGEDRDAIGCQEKVIAFEMEGAGVWDIMPTIIIKGVCDYADSHKNKDWQRYAATAAAACVKALLEEWRAQS